MNKKPPYVPRRQGRFPAPENGPSLFKGATPESDELSLAIRTVYERVQTSDRFFASPLGPLTWNRRDLVLPQFVYFGPDLGGEPVRFALLSGARNADRKGSFALLEWIHSLLEIPDAGRAPSVSVFPVVNVRRLLKGQETPDLGRENWRGSVEPEIAMLRENAHVRRYHGCVWVSATPDREPEAVVRTVYSKGASASNVEIYSAADFDPFSVRFEAIRADRVAEGPLGLFEEIGSPQFEVELRLPSTWGAGQWAVVLVPLIRRIVSVYRDQISIGGSL